MNRRSLLLILLLLPVLPGCYFATEIRERTWEEEAVAKIKVGRTSRAQVLQILGPPTEIVELLDSDAYIWEHMRQKETGIWLLVGLARNDRQYDRITVIVDRGGKVAGVGASFRADESAYGFPWTD